jgi:mono/diheme cytochrome c family protein
MVRCRFTILLAAAALAACSASAPAPAPAPVSEAAPPPAATPAAPDPYHPAPRDTVDNETYQGWKQYNLHCSRCHGDEATGSTFGPSLMTSFGPAGQISTKEKFIDVLHGSLKDKGMPTAAKMGLDSVYFDGIHAYLSGRGSGKFKGGRPARSEQPPSH